MQLHIGRTVKRNAAVRREVHNCRATDCVKYRYLASSDPRSSMRQPGGLPTCRHVHHMCTCTTLTTPVNGVTVTPLARACLTLRVSRRLQRVRPQQVLCATLDDVQPAPCILPRTPLSRARHPYCSLRLGCSLWLCLFMRAGCLPTMSRACERICTPSC